MELNNQHVVSLSSAHAPFLQKGDRIYEEPIGFLPSNRSSISFGVGTNRNVDDEMHLQCAVKNEGIAAKSNANGSNEKLNKIDDESTLAPESPTARAMENPDRSASTSLQNVQTTSNVRRQKLHGIRVAEKSQKNERLNDPAAETVPNPPVKNVDPATLHVDQQMESNFSTDIKTESNPKELTNDRNIRPGAGYCGEAELQHADGVGESNPRVVGQIQPNVQRKKRRRCSKNSKKNENVKFINATGSTKRMKCGFCEYSTNRASHFTEHVRTHTNERPYGCEMCERRFIRKRDARNHMKTHRNRCLVNGWRGWNEPISKSG